MRSDSPKRTGAGYFVLEETNDLWVDCPDVFSWKLKMQSKQLRSIFESLDSEKKSLVQRVGSFLRLSAVQHCSAQSQQPSSDESQILLLEFSRNPEVFRDALEHGEALQECREAMLGAGFQTALPGGAHLFVLPDLVPIALAAISQQGLTLNRRHVIVDQESEAQVMRAVKSLPSRAQVRRKNREAVQLPPPDPQSEGCVDVSEADDVEAVIFDKRDWIKLIVVKRTFIHVPIPASIYSGPSGGPKTVSTSDANPRVAWQPRRV